MAQAWYYRKGDRKVGPVSARELKQAAADGTLHPTDLVWTAGMGEWRPASKVKGLHFGSAPTDAPARPAAPAAARPADGPERRAAARKNSKLPWLLGGIAVLGLTCCGVPVAVLGLLGAGATNRQDRPEQAEGQPTAPPGETDGSPPRPADPQRPLPDFTKVNYDHDFTKADRTLPAGAKATVREGRVERGEKGLIGKWAVEDTYRTGDGKEVRHGKRAVWYDRDKSAKYLEDEWVHGKAHGPERKWHRNGKLMWESAYVEGEQHGRFRKWYEGGRQWIEGYCYQGKQHGPRTEWHESGKKMLEVVYVEDKQQGVCREWWEDGNLYYEESYLDGRLHGQRKVYTNIWYERKGALWKVESYDRGSPSGTWTYYFRSAHGGDYYSVDFPAGRWGGGTKSQFLARLSAMRDVRDCYPREAQGHFIVPHGGFLKTFGPPHRDVPYIGPETWQREWTYHCSDGALRFGIGTNGVTINMKAGP